MSIDSHVSLTPHSNEDEVKLYDFEKAIDAAGFGVFNAFLLLASLPGLWATIFETTTMSYVLPVAECDLQLTLLEKGALNAITYGGMLISAIPWGFVADTFGRKYTLVFALLMEGTLTLSSVLIHTSRQLMVLKFFGGFIASGPMAIFVSYISEFHGKKYRTYSVIAIGLINATTFVILPALGMLILPNPRTYNIGTLELKSWKIFIAVSAIPALLSGILLMFFPESPKYLMSKGKNDKALKAFKTIYAINKFKSGNSYPITTLLNEKPEVLQKQNESEKQHTLSAMCENFSKKIFEGLKQLPMLCYTEYVIISIMVCGMYLSLILSANSVRLWLPQYFSNAREMKHLGYTDLSTCSILGYSVNKTSLLPTKDDNDNGNKKCEVYIDPASFLDNIIISSTICVNYVMTTLLVKVIGNNNLLRIYLGVACLSLLSKYWSKSVTVALVLSSIYTACSIVSITLLLNTAINLYPTSIRTVAIVFVMSWGRLGSTIGNIILPVLMVLHCAAIYVFFSATILGTLFISFFVPNTTTEKLK